MTSTHYLLLFLALVALLLFDRQRSDRVRKRRLNHLFTGRELLTPQLFYDRYFSASGIAPELVIAIRQIFEQELETELPYLQPEDSFADNLRFLFAFDSMADVALVVALEEHFRIRIDDQEAQEARTVADLVQLVARKMARC